jgi:hypothetical protein
MEILSEQQCSYCKKSTFYEETNFLRSSKCTRRVHLKDNVLAPRHLLICVKYFYRDVHFISCRKNKHQLSPNREVNHLIAHVYMNPII